MRPRGIPGGTWGLRISRHEKDRETCQKLSKLHRTALAGKWNHWLLFITSRTPYMVITRRYAKWKEQMMKLSVHDGIEQEKQGDCFVTPCAVLWKARRLDQHFDNGMWWPYCSQKTFSSQKVHTLSCRWGLVWLPARKLIHNLILQPQGQEVGVGPEFVGLLQIFRGFSPLLH